jgi:hypothetical protein
MMVRLSMDHTKDNFRNNYLRSLTISIFFLNNYFFFLLSFLITIFHLFFLNNYLHFITNSLFFPIHYHGYEKNKINMCLFLCA